jgi:hypothetical protein
MIQAGPASGKLPAATWGYKVTDWYVYAPQADVHGGVSNNRAYGLFRITEAMIYELGTGIARVGRRMISFKFGARSLPI